MVPSSARISHRTPTDLRFPSFMRSTTASVWPALLSTPSSTAIKGNICPGLPKSSGLISTWTKALIVADRSLAEIPELVPCR